MYDIGIDLGTSAVKLLLVSDAGKVIKTVSRSYPLEFTHPGWSQQNPQDWWDAIVDGMPELLADIDHSQVAGIGVAGQMHGLVALDGAGQVLRPAILWNDGRTGEETEYLNNVVGKPFLLEHTGNIAFAGFTAPKILWMQKHEPELYEKIRMVLLPKDYVNYRLTGVYSSDYSDASGTLMLDVARKCWSPEMLELCGLQETQLPALHESYDIIGTLLPETAAGLGLPETVTVVSGAGDNAAAAIGTDCLREGQCNLSLGTSGTIFLPSDSFHRDDVTALHSFAHANGKYHLMGCMLSAASCLKWWTEEIETGDYSGLQAEISPTGLGNNPVFFLPYLMGERAPHNDPRARGAFIGMSMETSRSQMTQAVLEGVAFGLRDSLEAARLLHVSVASSTLCGGGAKSAVWQRILANVLNLPMQILEEEQGPGLGAAMLSAVSRGAFVSLEEAADRMVKIKAVVDPEPELMAAYEKQYNKFKLLYPALKEIYPQLQA